MMIVLSDYFLFVLFSLSESSFSSSESSIDYLNAHNSQGWDEELGGPLRIVNPILLSTSNDTGDVSSRHSSLETVVWGSSNTPRQPKQSQASFVAQSPKSTKGEWRTYPSTSSDDPRSLRSVTCSSRTAMLTSAGLFLTSAIIVGILYFGFPASFDKVF